MCIWRTHHADGMQLQSRWDRSAPDWQGVHNVHAHAPVAEEVDGDGEHARVDQQHQLQQQQQQLGLARPEQPACRGVGKHQQPLTVAAKSVLGRLKTFEDEL